MYAIRTDATGMWFAIRVSNCVLSYKKIANWYVYELCCPITGKPFYVGKGKGKRIDAHEKETKLGVCSKKCNKIRSINKNGFEIIKEKVALFWDEQAAYDYETDLIEEIGLKNLTNIMPGGQKAWKRRVREVNSRKPSPPLMTTLEQCVPRLACLVLYPNSYWFLPSDSELIKKIRKQLNDGLRSVIPKLIKSCLNDNRQRTIELFSEYGVREWQLEKYAA